MTDWLKIEQRRHQVAIGGRVIDGMTGKALAGARVEITGAPRAFFDRLAIQALPHGDRWATLAERPDRTRAGIDGHFQFLDLPGVDHPGYFYFLPLSAGGYDDVAGILGDYVLTVSLPGAGRRYSTAEVRTATAKATLDDAGGHQVETSADVALPPTAIRGALTYIDLKGKTQPLVMAELRIEGSGERTFSDSDGHYLLAGLEAGRPPADASTPPADAVSRRLRIRARGFVERTEEVLLRPGELETIDRTLKLIKRAN